MGSDCILFGLDPLAETLPVYYGREIQLYTIRIGSLAPNSIVYLFLILLNVYSWFYVILVKFYVCILVKSISLVLGSLFLLAWYLSSLHLLISHIHTTSLSWCLSSVMCYVLKCYTICFSAPLLHTILLD